MSEYQTEEEQIQQIKQWWNDNGRNTVLAIIIGLGAYFGWQAWTNHQVQQKENASNHFAELSSALVIRPDEQVSEAKLNGALDLHQKIAIIDDESTYSLLSGLMLAKTFATQDQEQKAIEYLSTVVEKANDDWIKLLAESRLARLYLATSEYDKALSLANKKRENSEFESIFNEIKGDAYIGKKDITNARNAYQLALINSGTREQIIGLKLADLGLPRDSDS